MSVNHKCGGDSGGDGGGGNCSDYELLCLHSAQLFLPTAV